MIYLLSDFALNTGTRSIGAYRLATALRQSGYDVDVIDFCSIWTIEEILEYIDSGPKPLWIGFSTTFSAGDITAPLSPRTTEGLPINDVLTRFGKDDRYFFNEIKKRAPVIIGGSRTARLKYFYDPDYFITGYADISVVKLSDYISGKSDELKYKTETIESLTGNKIVIKQKIIYSQESYPVNDVLDIATEYIETDFIEEGEILPLEVARGCIFSCAFCAYPLNGKKKNDYIRPKDQIIRDITNYQLKYKTKNFLVLDDTFNDSVEKLQMMVEVQKQVPYNFNFWAYGRLDLIASNQQMFDLIHQSGWKWMSFGIETFKKSTGSKIGKGADTTKLKNTLKKLKEHYPESWFNIELIVGLPGETKEDLNETDKWFRENPELWDLVNYKALGIPNIKFSTWHSKMQLQPEKYGITLNVIDENLPYYGWEHETMSASEAVEFTDLLHIRMMNDLNKLPSSVPNRVKTSYFIDMSSIPRPFNRFDWQKYTSDFYYRYKVKKLNSRSLASIIKKHVGSQLNKTNQFYFGNSKQKDGTN